MSEDGRQSNLSPRQDKAIVALLTEPTFGAAAEAAGVGFATLNRWMREDEDFRREFHRARMSAFTAAIYRLQVYSLEAVETLHDIMVDSKTAATPRVNAANSILDHATKAVELEHVYAKLRQIEAMIKDGGGHDHDA
jgi:hypothetical protein